MGNSTTISTLKVVKDYDIMTGALETLYSTTGLDIRAARMGLYRPSSDAGVFDDHLCFGMDYSPVAFPFPKGLGAEGQQGAESRAQGGRGGRKKAGQQWEGNGPVLRGPPADAVHSAHYNKAVVCRTGSVQQGDKVLPLYQKQLQRGKRVLEQEMSSFEFSSLSFPSSSHGTPLLS